MLRHISRFCSRFPWLVFLVVAMVTAAMLYQLKEKAYFEADMTKFLPKNIPAVKSDDYYKKNFNYRDAIMIGVEMQSGTAMQAGVLRSLENIVIDMKNLKASKTFQSMLRGEKVTIMQAVGIDPDTISSISNLEDAVLDKETGSVSAGSVIKKLKKDFGIPSPPGREEFLPESDTDLERIIPGLTERILGDRSFRGNLLTNDKRSASMRASMVSKYQYKKRYSILELSVAIDEERLKARFQGGDSTFPFEIYGKTVNRTLVDDEFIRRHASSVREDLRRWLIDFFKDTFDEEPGLKDLLDGEITVDRFTAVVKYSERNDFFMNPKIVPWGKFVNGMYEFMLKKVDPFSRENLEFQLHDVSDIYDLGEVYYLILDILDKHRPEDVTFHVAGNPVVIGVFTAMVGRDMGTLIPLAVIVVLLVLTISFRSARGVLIPAITVVLSTLWAMGVMASMGIPFTVTTSILPIILLAVGTAYGIHLLNRYYEDVSFSDDRREVVQTSVKNVGVAIVMAAVTTIAGFSSLATSDLDLIQHFGAFSAVGIGFALILTLTLTPAMLVLWRLPKKKTFSDKDKLFKQKGFIPNFMRSWTQLVIRRPKTVVLLLTGFFAVACLLATTNRFEGGMMSSFKEDNVLLIGDRFFNTKLTGTSNINLIFKFRDQIKLDNPQAQTEFQRRLDRFVASWDKLIRAQPGLNGGMAPELVGRLRDKRSQPSQGLEETIKRIHLIRDVLNEEYLVETVAQSENETSELSETGQEEDLEALDESNDNSLDNLAEDSEDGDDLGGLADDDSETDTESAGPFADLSSEQILGLKDLNLRMGRTEDDWENTAASVVTLRELKTSSAGILMQHEFNLLQDFLAVDVKQPIILHKLEDLYGFLMKMKEPQIIVKNQTYLPTGLVVTPVDFVRKYYKVFYHNDNPLYDRLPDVENDGFSDKTLTDRSIIGVALNQALSGGRDSFEGMINPNLQEFQVQIVLRNDNNRIIEEYLDLALAKVGELFPANDPYIEWIKVGGGAPTGVEVTNIISQSQMKSIMLSFLFVFIVTFFIFRSAIGGLYSLIPLLFTVMLNFGVIALLGGEITVGTMMVASISIGTGVDYTIHFLERLKIQLRAGNSLAEGYTNTVLTSGKAILLNAAAVAFGFSVLLLSEFVTNMMMGILMAGTMFFSSLGALTLLPAIVLITRPRFLEKIEVETVADPAVN